MDPAPHAGVARVEDRDDVGIGLGWPVFAASVVVAVAVPDSWTRLSAFSPVLLLLLPAPSILIAVRSELAMRLEARFTLTVRGLRSQVLPAS